MIRNVHFILICISIMFSCAPGIAGDIYVLDITGAAEDGPAGDDRIIEVLLEGKINHFGYPDFSATVPGVHVHVAGYPESAAAGVYSGDDGWWAMKVRKYAGRKAGFSFVYEKEGWITTKSNVIEIGDRDNTDIAIQFVDPGLFKEGLKPLTEMIATALAGTGRRVEMRNAVVATVGKSWASMHDDRLPHGDPGAIVNKIRGAIGPVYFDRDVKPNIAQKKISVDGGVAWVNAPPGVHTVTARKKGVEYSKVKFVIDEDDARCGIMLYIASPPDSIQGTNESAPGKN